MTTAILTAPQMSGKSKDCAEQQMVLYEAIQMQAHKARFNRGRFDVGDMVNEVFVRLADRPLPPIGSEKLNDCIQGCVREILRRDRRTDKAAVDVDDLEHGEHPFYTMDDEWEEAAFEEMFQKFCAAQEEAKREVYRLSRLHNAVEVARITGLSRYAAARMLKGMRNDFETFLDNFEQF